MDYKTIISLIKKELETVDKYLTEMLLCEKNFLSEKFIEFCLQNSKKIRPVVIILFLKSINAKITPCRLKICALIELLHNASLIHDDIVDNADIRRHAPSFNKIFDNKTSVLAGDFLLSLVLKELSKMQSPEITEFFSEALIKICEGELEQLSQKNQNISIEQYLKKSEKKTAELFKLGIKTTLLTDEKQADFVQIGTTFAEKFGTAFQIRDDLMNFTVKSDDKPYGNDLEEGNYTAPAIYYFQTNKFEKPSGALVEKIRQSSAIDKTKALLSEFVNEALDLTKNFADNQYKQALVDLCRLLEKV